MISVHLPKTAGTGFLEFLESPLHQVPFQVRRDYDDRPLHTPRWQRRLRALRSHSALAVNSSATDVIHGHFLPYKYRGALSEGRPFVTWLREPVSRLRSHYDYWLRSFDDNAGPLHARVAQEQWTFERFALGPELRNLYSEFLWRFPLENFAFVGITEHYDEDLQTFAARFGLTASEDIHTPHVNSRDDVAPDIESSLREKISQYHAKDLALYQQALDWRKGGRWRA